MFSSLDPTREGGILVLPHGASREDLIHTERIHEYAKRNAPYWYQDVNGYGGIVHTNGSLFLVTGCDKTTGNDWTLASFPYYPGAKGHFDLQYNWQPDYISPWIDHDTARTSYYAPPTSRPIPVEPAPDISALLSVECEYLSAPNPGGKRCLLRNLRAYIIRSSCVRLLRLSC